MIFFVRIRSLTRASRLDRFDETKLPSLQNKVFEFSVSHCQPVCVSVCLSCVPVHNKPFVSAAVSHCLSVPPPPSFCSLLADGFHVTINHLCLCLSVCLPPALSHTSLLISACLLVRLPFCLSACLSVRLPFCLSVCLPICPLAFLSACLSVRSLSVCLPICPLAFLSDCPLAFLSDCLSVRLPFCLSVCPLAFLSACLCQCRPACLSVCRLLVSPSSLSDISSRSSLSFETGQ